VCVFEVGSVICFKVGGGSHTKMIVNRIIKEQSRMSRLDLDSTGPVDHIYLYLLIFDSVIWSNSRVDVTGGFVVYYSPS